MASINKEYVYNLFIIYYIFNFDINLSDFEFKKN
jgi:hypothetical protein